jgi:hypothetical protein
MNYTSSRSNTTRINLWQKINDELEGEKGVDLACRLMMETGSK